jgi:hypothetical protein
MPPLFVRVFGAGVRGNCGSVGIFGIPCGVKNCPPEK